jgi:uncharacterized SAM-dependent methyltransferase
VKALLHTDAIRIDSWLSVTEDRSLAYDVLDGLTRPFKELPPKHFYDARGSALFERICELAAGEELRTEISAKFTRARLEADYAAAGLELDRWYADPDGLFALSLAARV